MSQTLLKNGLAKGFCYGLLSNHISKGSRSESPGDHLIISSPGTGVSSAFWMFRRMIIHTHIRTPIILTRKVSDGAILAINTHLEMRQIKASDEIIGKDQLKSWEGKKTGARSTPTDTTMAAPVRA